MSAYTHVRVVVVGLGQMGRYHVNAYRAAGATLAAVCDADAARAEAIGRELSVPWFTDLAAALSLPRLDAVSICTPPYLHRPMVASAMAAGLDVLCEKPLAGSLDDGRELAAALPSDRIFMLCFFHRFHEPIERLRELLNAGALGEPRVLRNRFALDMRQDQRPWIWDPARAGGGAVLNTSVHSIDLFRFLIGEPERVVARMQPRPGEGVLERDVQLLLEGPRSTGILEAASYAVRKEFSLSLETEDALVEVGWNPPSLRIVHRGQDVREEVPIAAPSALTRIEAAVAHFLACVCERRQPRASVQDGLRALEIAGAAYRSVAESRFVACGPDGLERPAHPR